MLEALCVVLGIAGIGGGLFLAFRSAARQHERREALCQRQGWVYERLPEQAVLWRMGGHTSSGEAWRLELRRGRGKNSSSSTVWTTGAGAVDGAVLLGPTTAGMGRVPLSNPLVQLALKALLGDIAEALSDAREVEVGGAAFREHYGVLATSETLAAEALSGPAELALAEWATQHNRPLHPVVMMWRDGLTLRVRSGLGRDEDLVALVDLGELILAARS